MPNTPSPTNGAVLTLRRGGREEHPTEAARRALLLAADVETPDWASILRRMADSLPERAPIRTGGR